VVLLRLARETEGGGGTKIITFVSAAWGVDVWFKKTPPSNGEGMKTDERGKDQNGLEKRE